MPDELNNQNKTEFPIKVSEFDVSIKEYFAALE